MAVPTTVRAALADHRDAVAGSVCLDAGAGVGNSLLGLLDTGADRVYAVTDDPGDARAARGRVRDERPSDSARTAVVESDVRALPFADDAVDVVVAHALCNCLPRGALDAAFAEFARVAAPDALLLVDDYDPLPEDAGMRGLLAVENAAAELSRGVPAQTFYPARLLRHVAADAGWSVAGETTLLEPVPWTPRHVHAHAAAARAAACELPEALASPLVAEADRRERELGREDAGRMYALAFTRG